MRITHVLLETAHGALSYADLVSGGRGVTGSEQAMLYLAREQARQGHVVRCYLPTDSPGFADGVECLDVRAAWPRLRRLDYSDVVVSWLSADPLRLVGPGPLRVHSCQINDWLLNTYGYQQHVDVFVACSEAHKGWLQGEAGHPSEDAVWEVIPNGVDLGRFQGSRARVPRRCVYVSSPDRGLHWLLAMWPEIHFAYPDAELHIFYEVQKWLDHAILLNSEVGMRARYVVRQVPALARHGVVLRGAVSPAELANELLQADVLLYPTDTVRPTEGWGVAVAECCAAGVVPVITDCDALGEVYGASGAVMVPRSLDAGWTDAFLEAALGLLGSEEEKESRRMLVRDFSARFGWDKVAGLWEEMVCRKSSLSVGAPDSGVEKAARVRS